MTSNLHINLLIMKSIILIVTMLLISTSVHAENEVLYNTLDSVVANRHKYTKEKEARLSMLKQRIQRIPLFQIRLGNGIRIEGVGTGKENR